MRELWKDNTIVENLFYNVNQGDQQDKKDKIYKKFLRKQKLQGFNLPSPENSIEKNFTKQYKSPIKRIINRSFSYAKDNQNERSSTNLKKSTPLRSKSVM